MFNFHMTQRSCKDLITCPNTINLSATDEKEKTLCKCGKDKILKTTKTRFKQSELTYKSNLNS